MSAADLVEVRITPARRCGFRKPGGLYLVAKGLADPCAKLPIILEKCPCCGAGIKPARGWTWVDGDAILSAKNCLARTCAGSAWLAYCTSSCPLAGLGIGRAGLLWVGESFYPSPLDFEAEAAAQGISRRLIRVPKGFEVGKTWVLLAHRKAVWTLADKDQPQARPAIFRAFRPTAIEYVTRGTETEDELQRLVDRGITPLREEWPETISLPFSTDGQRVADPQPAADPAP